MAEQESLTELTELLDQIHARGNLEHSLLLGYYGGGNYGDELLLEILANLLASRGIQDATITYQDPKNYTAFHHDFGYKLAHMHDKKALLGAVLKNKTIIVGGGGLWGRDFNFNMLLLSLMLFASRWLLRKKVYLLGVGYYRSTSWLGHFGAFLAGKSANATLARDQETLTNFRKVSKHTFLSRDIAWYVKDVDATAYTKDVAKLDKKLKVRGKTLFFTLRKLEGYYSLIGECLAQNQDKPAMAGLLVPRKVRPDGFQLLSGWQLHNKNLQIFDLESNPLGLFYFFRKHRDNLAVIGPQYHIIITAHLSGVPFMPIVYDNKVTELLRQIKDPRDPLPVQELDQKDLQEFIDDFYDDFYKKGSG